MFIDETGDATSTPFTLTGVIFENKYCVDQNAALSELKTKINQLKKNVLGQTILFYI